MKKAELYEKAKKYYDILNNTVKSNKQKRSENAGHAIFDKGSHPAVVATSAITVSIGLGIALYALAGLPSYVAISVGAASAFAESYVLPKIVHQAILHGKGKFARGYAKMELDNYFVAFKDYVKQYQKDFLKSSMPDEVSMSDLEDFAQMFENCSVNYKTTLDKLVGKTIFKRNQADLKRISKILKSSKDEQKSAKKIENIINKNQKFTKPWCDLYNKCGDIAKNLYASCKDLNPNFQVPAEHNFRADYDFVQKKVDTYLRKENYVEVSNSVTFAEAESTLAKSATTKAISKYDKIRAYLEKKEAKNEDCFGK